MPLPMVHFAIATQLAARTQQYPAADFLLVSTSPITLVATFVEAAVDLIDAQLTSWGVRQFVGE